jgi:serine/threonine protein kinase
MQIDVKIYLDHFFEISDVNSQKEVNDFIREGLQMKVFHHPNVMELVGICWVKDSDAQVQMSAPLIVLPFMERGDLKNYLRKSRPGKLPPEEAVVCKIKNHYMLGRHFLYF